ncbi:MAG: YicC family protein [Bacteroidales bacterium]|nr:YicC family protein [Bacteroidales bacterium]
MIRSMTGFGKSIVETSGKKISIEIRSLNSKQIEINTRMPWVYKEKEIELRNILSRELERGKIDLFISADILEDQSVPTINKSVVKNYYRQLNDIAGELYIDSPDQLLPVIMRLPDTLRTEKEELSEKEWAVLKDLIIDAIRMIDGYRKEEGKAMETDIITRITNILSFLNDIEPFEKQRITTIREKLINSLKSIPNEKIDMNRFEQELILYLEKLDLNEEKVRLKKHCDYFLETINAGNSNGKKLGFISQEIGREVNTIGSKANDAAIQKIVVKMKDELEKIKEQVLNIL